MATSSILDFSNIPTGATGAFKRFEVSVSDEVLENLQTLLRLFPIAGATYESTRPERSLGVTHKWLSDAVHTWQHSFNWRDHEAYMNSFPHFLAPIKDENGKDYSIHFVALFSKRSDAIPLMLLHGWPGSFIEFLPMLDKIRNTYAADTLPYHLVVPSLPGYAFSSPPPRDIDFRIEDIARLFNKLALSLGFEQGYVVQGGDLGSKVARVMAAEHLTCKAAHTNFCIMPEPSQPIGTINELERQGLERAEWFGKIGSAYALEHATRPSTIGFALASNPIALLAWIGEKFLEWTDKDPAVDVVLESVTLYWVTGCISTSLYPYRQLFTPGKIGAHENPAWYIHKPFGLSWFPKEIAPIPQAWAATTGDLVFYRQHDSGGHFAAIEQTDTLWADFEAFVKQIWTNI